MSDCWRGVVSGLRTKRNDCYQSACREERKYHNHKSILPCGRDYEGKNGHKHQYLAQQYVAEPVGLSRCTSKSLHNEVRRILSYSLAELAARIGKGSAGALIDTSSWDQVRSQDATASAALLAL